MENESKWDEDFRERDDDFSLGEINDDGSENFNDFSFPTLPSGDSDIRLIKKSFKKCFDRAKRLQEYFFRLGSAAGISSGQKSFIHEWLPKLRIIHDIEDQLGNCESTLLKASGAARGSIPSFLNLASIQAG